MNAIVSLLMAARSYLGMSRFWVAQLAGWLLLVGYGVASTAGSAIPTPELIQSSALWGGTGILFSSLLAIVLCRVAGMHVLWTCLTVIVGSIVTALPWAFTVHGLRSVMDLPTVPDMGDFGVLRCAVVLMAWSAVFLLVVLSHRVMLEREARANADAATQGAQLALLRAQLNPHFLFNSLNSIVALIDEDPERAQKLVRDLAQLLRRSLRASKAAAPVREELEFLKLYVACEKVRFEEHIQVEWDVEDDASAALIPAMILQPLVENAVRYGGDGSDAPVHVRVGCHVDENVLVLDVANTGTLEHISGVQRAPSGNGVALDNVKERLTLMYHDDHRFDLFERQGWVHARVQLPLEKAS